MSAERFLIVSYFVTGGLCLCLALAAWAWLRQPAERIFAALQRPVWERILKRSFPTSTILLALSGFLSVSYYGCENRPYESIVSDRAYIISVSQKQISETLNSIAIAAFVWAAVILLTLVIIRRTQTNKPPDQS